MTKIVFHEDFSVNGIHRLKVKAQLLSDGLPGVRSLFIRKSIDYLEQRAKHHLGESIGHSWYTPSGALMNSFQKVYGAEFGRLFNDYFTASLVEYGTGIVGKGTHPTPKGHQYDVNNHGDDGWVYLGKDGEYHFTRGMEAHRYMYNALIDYISGAYKRIFNEAFNQILGGKLNS